MDRKNAGQIIDLETKDESRAAYYFRERGLCAILPLYHTEERLLGWVAFASPDLHAEDLARLETQLPIITEKFQLILNYEDVIVSAKKTACSPSISRGCRAGDRVYAGTGTSAECGAWGT